MTTQLSPAQHAILAHAINHTSGQIDWFPDNIKGGARKKAIDALFNRVLIINDGTNWIVASEGYEALGMTRPVLEGHNGASQVLADEIGTEDPTDAEIDASNIVDPEIEAAVTAIETAARTEMNTPRTRDNSKQATVIGMLKRPEGATIPQIMAATGWLSHTVRGTFAGTFKKKLGLALVSDKGESDRVYRIAV
jgi:hypothetical protein